MSTKDILVITLSNLGDVVLTLPVIGVLKRTFPESRISVMVGSKAKELFEKDPGIYQTIEYDKFIPFRKKLKLVLSLRRRHYDIVIDLRNTFFPFLLGKLQFNHFRKPSREIKHMRDRHIWKFTGSKILAPAPVGSIYIPNEDEAYIDAMMAGYGIKDGDMIITVAPGAKSHTKRWTTSGFAQVCDRLIQELGAKVVMIGDEGDENYVKDISLKMKFAPFNAVKRTSICQFASIIKRSALLISNDSSPVHIAGVLRVPVVAIFGPTDPEKYGPTGINDRVIQKDMVCVPCERPLCRINPEHPDQGICMEMISADEVFDAAKSILETKIY